jgi:hypothetical protein
MEGELEAGEAGADAVVCLIRRGQPIRLGEGNGGKGEFGSIISFCVDGF